MVLCRSILFLFFIFLWLMGCNRKQDPSRLQIFAASSLLESFQSLKTAFEEKNPNRRVVLSLAGSQTLAFQIRQGAQADVFVSADPHHIQELTREDLLQSSKVFAYNQLAIIVPKGNKKIVTFRDLPEANYLVLGSENVPIGHFSRLFLRNVSTRTETNYFRKVMAKVVSEENSVRLVRAKVELGAADAAIVYRTDALNVPSIRMIEIPSTLNVRIAYSIGVGRHGKAKSLTRKWLDFLNEDVARKILIRHGFEMNPK